MEVFNISLLYNWRIYLLASKVTLKWYLTVLSKEISCLVSHSLHSVWSAWCLVSVQGSWHDTIMLYLLVLNCRGGGLYVASAKSVTVTFAVVTTGTGPFLSLMLWIARCCFALCCFFAVLSCCLCFAFTCSDSNSRIMVWERGYH